ncbi:zeta toxin family protein [Nonomuraea sp. NPDC050022]|uniref:AAA family ATPase n=1 Tax=Nonomuraea sp. NPDC050022 TaxID=3364358 RepID=UPI0037A85A9F
MEDQPAGGLAPLYLLAGAPGAGKTTLLPYLLRNAGGLVVMDMDELLEDGALLGVPIAEPQAAPVWPAYDRLWTHIVTMVRRAGTPVLLLCPVPDAHELVPEGRWGGPVHWALLDCPDEVRVDRLRARDLGLEWIEEGIEDAIEDAAQGRALIPLVFRSGSSQTSGSSRNSGSSGSETGSEELGGDVAGLASRILSWAGSGTTTSGAAS